MPTTQQPPTTDAQSSSNESSTASATEAVAAFVDATTDALVRVDVWDATIQTVEAAGNYAADIVDGLTTSTRQQPVLSRAANKIAAQLGEIYAASKEPGLNTWFLEAKRLERCPSKSGAFRSGRQNICPRRILSDPAMITTHPPTSEVAQPAVHRFSPSPAIAGANERGEYQ